MAKIFGTMWPTDKAGDKNDKRPDFKGTMKIGGVNGHNAAERNEDAAKFLLHLSRDLKENEEEGTWMSIACWKRTNDDGDGYLSIVLEDNEWRKENFKKNGKPKKATEDLDW